MKKPLEGADGLASQDLPRRDLANEHAKNARSRVSQAAASASQPDEAVCNIDPSMLSASGERYLTANTADMVMLQRPTDAKSSTLSELASAPRLNLGGTGRSTAPHPGKETTGSNFSFPPNERKDASYSTTRLAKSSFSAKPSGTSSYHEHTGRSRDDDADWEMNVVADSVVYTRTQIEELLEMLREGNKASGGLKEMGRFYGIVGFIRFTSTYYMVLISKRSVVALLGGHYVFHCDETKIVPICDPGMLASLGGRSKVKEQEETRLLATFKQVDLSKNFYFSYTYDLTKTLQDNLTSKAEAEAGDGHVHQDHRQEPLTAWGFNEKFVWNHHLLMPAFGSSVRKGAALGDGWYGSEWVLPLVYGFVDQAKLSVLNRTIYVTLIARRSRHFAGARFLKRGVTDRGQVANDVETEQIVNEPLTSPFFAPGTGESSREGATYQPFIPSPRFTSYVMHRGSIPIYWTQDSTNMSPRPPIEISVVDPYYSAAALHFDDMFRRYGAPVIILNLIKSKEKQPREVKLLRAFGECVNYLNQFLPEEKKLKYIAWDMSRASKSRDQDVIGVLEDIAEETIENTKFFHSGPEPASFAEFATESTSARREQIQVQSGVARVNCVDCLDRTNAAQFVIGKAAFGHQLHALGLLDHPTLPFDSDAVNMLTEMYHDLGDTIALQYGGSHLVNTMETYRKINQWSSHSRDMLEGIKRYYANSFVDAEKQAAINLFLGVDAEMPETNRLVNVNNPRYQKWFIPQHLGPHDTVSERIQRLLEVVNSDKGFWAEYYRPRLFTDMARHHAYKMTAVHQHHPMTPMHQTNHIPISPSSIQQTQVIVTSPFVNKYAPAAIGRHNQSSSSGLFEENNRAIIGGVRRWMSINKAGAGPVTKRKRSKMYASGEDGRAEISINEKRDKTGATGTGAAAGLAAEIGLTASAATGPAGAFPAFEVALCRIQMPTVSAEEASEYEWYATQFADVSFSQTHHVDEADVAMYEDGAAVAAGAVDKVASLLVGGAGQSREGEKNAQLDPVLLAYANALPGSKALISKLEKVSDAKIRAYSNWLQSHVPK
ncbi:hypothetical protein K437DRAFT_290418 [Tilletiaria anomala UBC 951]|uniref:SAC domain-containing protein n=1 Tax=Tilletiaria anomala (strain ATCC 24038 / CBS 436.72 / UBC 951) TaxID=1037660 RepID=A0A066WBI5_TILAU|nr:uncharacterized protein K437DRAFT_290418 [Tilletiaria anomala UBC 951]KDN48439.1 hypothetical protein K437DRAFT_290418 [Tilletiaria anomala UBC 951]